MSKKPSPLTKQTAKAVAAKATAKPIAKTVAAAVPIVVPAGAKPASDPTQAFLREVDDALQQEKMLALWLRYRVALVSGIAVLLVGVIGWQVWQNNQLKHTAAIAKNWYTYQGMSLDNGEGKSQLRAQIEAEGDNGYRALAILDEAATAPDAATANTIYGKVYEDNSQPKWLRDIAELNAAMRLMGTDNNLAQTHFEKLVTYADPREATAASAVALEQLAVLAIGRGDVVSAKGYTEKLLQIPTLMPDMRQRAEKRLGAL